MPRFGKQIRAISKAGTQNKATGQAAGAASYGAKQAAVAAMRGAGAKPLAGGAAKPATRVTKAPRKRRPGG